MLANATTQNWRRQLFAFAFCLPLLAGAATADERDAIRRVVEGYRHNREAFDAFLCHYRVTQGTAATADAAMAGEIDEADVYEMTWVVDGKRRRMHTSPVNTAAQRKMAEAWVLNGPLIPEHLLEMGELELVFAPMKRSAATLYGDDSDPLVQLFAPFSVSLRFDHSTGELLAPIAVMERLLRDTHDHRVEEVTIDGETRLVIHGQSETIEIGSNGARLPPREIDVEYVIDPARGFLLERWSATIAGEQPAVRYALTDVRKCSENRWFPMRSLIMSPPDSDGRIPVTEIEVLALESENPPGEADFAITLPSGTEISDQRDSGTSFTINEPLTVTPNDLPQLLNRATKTLAERFFKAKTAQPPPSGDRNFGLVTIVAVVFVAGAVLLYFRFRRGNAGR